MFKNKSKKFVALLATLVLVLCLAIGGTVAYIFDISDNLKNAFEPGVVTTAVVETISEDKTVKEDVQIKNTGNIDAWLRATVVVNWKDADGNVYGKAEPVKDTDYELISTNGNWLLGKDGFYYWNEPVPAGETTGNLIDSCQLKEGVVAPDGYYLSVEILGSGIQSRPTAVFEKAWGSVADKGLSMNSTGTLLEKIN